MRSAVLSLLAFCAPAWAAAQETRPFCTDRPGLGTPACTIEPGRLAIELGVIDWERDSSGDARTDVVSGGDLLLRYGLTERLEAQLGWTALTRVRTRLGERVERRTGTGDLFLALRRNLKNPDGSGLSAALMPFATLPTGSNGMGAGDWSAGLLVPVSAELPAGFGIALTGSIEAAVDEDRDGRHLAYGSVIGVDLPTGSDAIGATVEIAARRDRDPEGTRTEWLAGLSGAWSPSADLQFDIGADLGLDRDTPDLILHLGLARRF
jgi:hypothetical protein